MATQDGYELYYTEKLWNWIPGFYREEDAYTDSPGTLREIVESMGTQSAELRRALDRLWENSFVELADDDALVKLGELVATRMVSELNRRARRVDVARTIYYRRRKGTPWVLERLINDIAGWTGSHLDTRRRLGRTYHLLEQNPPRMPVTQTPRGGLANLHSPRIPALAYTAFEELNHTPDFRRARGEKGRYGVAKLGVHLHRARAFPVRHPTTVLLDSTTTWKYALDPSGRAVALFQPADRPSGDAWTRPREWQMPRAIDCRLFAHAEYEWTKTSIAEVGASILLDANQIAVLQGYAGWRFRSDLELERLLTSLNDPDFVDANNLIAIKDASLVADCGRARLYGSALSLTVGENNNEITYPALTRDQVLIANLDDWGTNLDPTLVAKYGAIVDPRNGAVMCPSVPLNQTLIAPLLHYGAIAELGAGTYSRRASIVTAGVNYVSAGGDAVGPIAFTPSGGLDTEGIDELTTSKTYTPPVTLNPVTEYRLQASDLERPYVLVRTDLAKWSIPAKTKGIGEVRTLVFDGLWIGIEEEIPNPAVTVAELELSGTWDRVEIRNCTLDPGGEKIAVPPAAAGKILPVQLKITGYIEELIIESSILSTITENNVDADPCSVGKITIRDSIVTHPTFSGAAISTQYAEIHIERSTIGGSVTCNRLYASDSIIYGAGTIADLQHGCFRFSAGVEGNWPRAFESYFFSQPSGSWIETINFGQSGYLRLTDNAPLEMREGAENHCEMGAYNHLLEAVKRADLRTKLDEFMPFDLIEHLDMEN